MGGSERDSALSPEYYKPVGEAGAGSLCAFVVNLLDSLWSRILRRVLVMIAPYSLLRSFLSI
jgi:hypothetical protein